VVFSKPLPKVILHINILVVLSLGNTTMSFRADKENLAYCKE
jgi:hypothetical protein